ncbi:MAG TPA: alpha-glucosidase C-terminal domain-containing protein, partial [Acidobacteriaceae bacterium]|nr:alpha-glucosidase C-terminal domain-containing protein [Acidobacteriaceae bacterium]
RAGSRRPRLRLQLHTAHDRASRKTPAFVYGDYKDLDPQHPHIFVYTRTLGPERYLVIHNFSAQPIAYTLPGGATAGALTMDNYAGNEAHTPTLHLRGWESRIYKQ